MAGLETPRERTHLAIGGRILMAVAVCAAVTFTWACESAHGFWVKNETDDSVFLRLDETGDDWVYVYLIGPHSDGIALRRFGPWQGGSVEILDAGCQTMASFDVGPGGASILVDPSGSRLTDRDVVIPDGNPSRQYERVDRCGGSTPDNP